MYTNHHMRQYQQQSIATASPEQLVVKLYDLGIAACHQSNRPKLRAILVELVFSLDLEAGGEMASSLQAIYEFCLNESITGDINVISDLLNGLREAWVEGVLGCKAA